MGFSIVAQAATVGSASRQPRNCGTDNRAERGCIRRISRSALDCRIVLYAFPGAGRLATLLRLAAAAQSRSIGSVPPHSSTGKNQTKLS